MTKYFILFIKKPSFLNYKNKPFSLFRIMQFFIVTFIIKLLLVALVKSLIVFFDINLLLKKPINLNFNNSYVFAVVIFLPIVEEFLFRAYLKPKKIFLILCIASLFFLIFNLLNLITIINSLIILIIVVIVYLILSRVKFDKKILIFYENNYSKIVYLSVFLFGLFHIFNYKLTLQIVILAPFLMIPHLFSGFVYAFIRVKFGLFSSILFHAFNNLLPFLIFALLTK